MKTTAKTLAENLPTNVAAVLLAKAKERKVRNVSLRFASTLYFAEDARYTAIDGAEAVTVQAGGEWSGNGGPCNKTVELPAGAFIIEESLFMGRWFITVIHNNGEGNRPSVADIGRFFAVTDARKTAEAEARRVAA
jgi:hypothetical protein